MQRLTNNVMTHAERAAEAIRFCREIALRTDVAGQTTRLFLSAATRQVHDLLADRMRRAGMQVRLDGAGNLRGLLPGAEPHRPPLLIGSHIDTVPNAGAFDGVLGVVLSIALAESAGQRMPGERVPFAIEVIAFSEEEGVRFGVPFIGSRALTGMFDDELLSVRDRDGITVRQALQDFGLVPAAEPISAGAAYLEIHIEQGPVLESLGVPLGIVETIAGQRRMEIRFSGCANHAGTTPMHLRYDALAAAAEWILEVEREALTTPGLVATVGRIEVIPGAGNVVAGEALCALDVRHAMDAVRQDATKRMLNAAAGIAKRRGIAAGSESKLDQPAVAMDVQITQTLADAAADCKIAAHRMVSGAGHDAMILAARVPAAMLFVRSPGGISHHPDESVFPDDVAAALTVGVRFLERLAAHG